MKKSSNTLDLAPNSCVGLSKEGSAYADAYFKLLATQKPEIKEKILAAKGDDINSDRDVTDFVRKVCELAENPPKNKPKAKKAKVDIDNTTSSQ